jgi:DNA-binding NtrC family response regulator
VVDDEEGIRHGLKRLFLREGFEVEVAEGCSEALAIASRVTLDAAVIDIRLKNGASGLDLLRELKRAEPELVVVVVTGYGSIDTAVEAMRQGAADYIVKPIDNIKLLDAVRKNLRLRQLQRENLYLRGELHECFGPPQFITRNAAMRAILEKADRIKNSPVTVLIGGESGTGKEVLARYIHDTSNRRDARFVSINCASLSETLLLSELFGHEKGAFTGAIERKPGRFEIADGGTLFLDEIGDMSPDIQAKLLRVIEESGFERVGGTKRIVVDVRIIAATNRDLPGLIRAGRFREDLFYRLNVVSLVLPPLRERREDIPLLVDHFLRKYNARYHRRVDAPPPELLASLCGLPWPGNVRELENLINRAVLLSEGTTAQLEGVLKGETAAVADAGPGSSPAVPLKSYLEQVQETHEKRFIEEALRAGRGNRSLTARRLGVTRKTLLRKIRRYGLEE